MFGFNEPVGLKGANPLRWRVCGCLKACAALVADGRGASDLAGLRVCGLSYGIGAQKDMVKDRGAARLRR